MRRARSDIEDGVIWVHEIGDDGVLAFTCFGVRNVVELIKIHEETKSLPKRDAAAPAAYDGCLRRCGASSVIKG